MIVRSTATCDVCHAHRGYIYAGPVYMDQPPTVCPWCIADGSVYERFGAVIMDDMEVGGHIWCDVDDSTRLAVLSRTPGFIAWTIARWAACCGDAAEYVATAGHQEIVDRFPDVIPDLQLDVGVGNGGMPLDVWHRWFAEFDLTNGPVAHIFRCKRCGRHTGYCDPD